MLDVVNRGNTVAVPNFNRATRPAFVPGSDPNPPDRRRRWLPHEAGLGGDLLRLAVRRAGDRRPPPACRRPRRATRRGARSAAASTPSSRRARTSADFLLSDRGHLAYPAADLEERDALLTVRDQPDGPAETIPRERWRFARAADGRVVSDPRHIQLEGGFEKGRLYQVAYTAEGAPVLGLAMAALRDSRVLAQARGAAEGNPAPGALRWAYAYGRSQTGRLLRTLVYEDLNLDEQGREAFDGIIANVAGGMRGEFNQRFGQNSKDRNHMMAHLFPFADLPATDPDTGMKDALHARLDARGQPAARLLHEHLGRVPPRRRLAAAHRPRRHARRRPRPPRRASITSRAPSTASASGRPADSQTAPADPTGAVEQLAEPPRRGRLLPRCSAPAWSTSTAG